MDDDRTTRLEIKCAFLEKSIADLDAVVREQADALDALKGLVERMQEKLAARGDDVEVLGAMPEDDPVPRSG